MHTERNNKTEKNTETENGIVIVTGSSGRIGSAVMRRFAGRFGEVVGFDREAPKTQPPTKQPRASFDEFVKHEGLNAIGAQLARMSERPAEERRTYAKYAKTLLRVGNGKGAAKLYQKALGHRLEIVAEADPFSLRRGGTLPVRLLFDGKPLAGARIVTGSPPQQLQYNRTCRACARTRKGALASNSTGVAGHTTSTRCTWFRLRADQMLSGRASGRRSRSALGVNLYALEASCLRRARHREPSRRVRRKVDGA